MRLILSALFLLFILPFSLLAQDHRAEVEKQFTKYYDHIRNKQFSEATDFMNPGFFKLVPKEQLVMAMEKSFSDPSLEYVVEGLEMQSVSDLRKIEGQSYCKLVYKSRIRMKFTGDDTRGADTSVMKRAFESQFGAGNVSYDPKTEFYSINTTKRAVANSADGMKWTFVVVEEKQRKILETFVPKELLD